MIPRISLSAVVSLLMTLGTIGYSPRAVAADADKPQYYELRTYFTKSDEQQKRINDYWQNATVPAYNRMGIKPIGVFTEIQDSATNRIFVLIPCDSLEAFGGIPAKLAADTAYQSAATDFLSAPKTNPAFDHSESVLLVAFNGMKHLTVPPEEKKPNVFELRTYFSPSENKHLNKVQMFESGEIDIMKELGLAPVFYGREVIGTRMPCLIYMTCGENMDEHKKHWQAFNNSPVWKKLSGDPFYKDNMVGMSQIMLKRTAASQI